MNPTMPCIELTAVAKSYGKEDVLSDINLTVSAGEIHALVGLNGAGKTTLMRLVLGMTRAGGGTVRVRGRDVGRLTSAEWRGVGHLIETPLAYPELTVEANLRIAGRLAGLTAQSARAAASRMAEELLLTPWWGKRSRALSLGNRQRLGLAAALIDNPSIVVLDEPTNALDPAGVVAVRTAITCRVAQGMAALVSSHHLDEVARMANRITVINAGRTIGGLEPDAPDIERRFFELVYADVERSL
ncbi:ABC transporter [Arthrobacter sp. ERGS1:01]|uniref:ABC transporter ATP-binding protein n=1 Tax=Arthrobacter sp. ERGS1:01 TaxID=1704044 RepID=UPI0006B5E109|nr:ABC transporter ATP-binding protein [Arthrobacter sp. ERGS1:01]ALE06303.1 ABC transporter [Arthrobacter sp. ERGS1:01]